MDEEILDDATLFGSPEKAKKEEKTFKPFEPEVFDRIIEDGTPGDLEMAFQEYGIESASVKNSYMKKQEKAASDKAMSARAFEFAKSDLAIVDDLLETKNYEYLGEASYSLAGNWGLSDFAPGFGSALASLKKLKASKFLQNVDLMKNLGSLSNQEGGNLSSASEELFAILPDENGVYPPVVSEEWIKNRLLAMQVEYKKATERLARGERVDPVTGETMSQQAFTKKNPDLSVPPTAVVEADANKDAGVVDPNVADLRNSPMTRKEMNEFITNFAKNAKPGQKLIYPDGKTIVKQ